jgi:hypothetical protein
MPGAKGAEFGEVAPKNQLGQLRMVNTAISPPDTITLPPPNSLENGTIVRVSPYRSFSSIGQQVIFTIGIFNPPTAGNFLTSVRLKPWWARRNVDYRQPGDPAAGGYNTIDRQTFLGTTDVNNRYIWIPAPKRLDLTQFITPPPPASPLRHSDSLFLDDVWKWDLQAPTDPAYAAAFPAPQVVSRWSTFMYPAMGLALGFTHEVTTQTGSPLSLTFTLSWITGTLGGTNYQESLG